MVNKMVCAQTSFMMLVLVFAVNICTPAVLHGYSVQLHAGIETIELELNPTPPGRLMCTSTDCSYDSGLQAYRCTCYFNNPSWIDMYTLAATITPKGSYDNPYLDIYYFYDGMNHVLDSREWPLSLPGCTLPGKALFFMSEYFEHLSVYYNSNTGTKILVEIASSYTDGIPAYRTGGPGENEDSCFCGGSSQPGKPSMKCYRPGGSGGGRGGGPGG